MWWPVSARRALCVELSSLHIQPDRGPRAGGRPCGSSATAARRSCRARCGGSRPGLRVVDCRSHRRRDGGPHDLGHHRPWFKMASPAGATSWPSTSDPWRGPPREKRRGARRGRRLGRPSGGPRILDVIGEHSPGRDRPRGLATCSPSTGTAPRPPCCSCLDSSSIQGGRARSLHRAMASGRASRSTPPLLQVVEPGRSAPRDQLSGEGERTD